jgi:hypothetical protein
VSLGGDRIVEHGRVQRSPPRWGIPATGVFVETLLGRGVEGDVQEAETAVERLAGARTTTGWWRAKPGCCGYARCWPAPAARRSPTDRLGRGDAMTLMT